MKVYSVPLGIHCCRLLVPSRGMGVAKRFCVTDMGFIKNSACLKV